MKIPKANLEHIVPKFGKSFFSGHYEGQNNSAVASSWHFHPEIEIVYVRGGNGVRHVGNHLSYFEDGDLVLIGSGLAHNGFTDINTGNIAETVVQFTPDFLGMEFIQSPEMSSINKLFQRSLNGISFHGSTKEKIGKQLEALQYGTSFESVIKLLNILNDLANSEEYQELNAQQIGIQYSKQDNDRAAMIFRQIRKNYQTKIELKDIAKQANMTTPSFCRYFKKLTTKTFTQFVNEFRVIEACKLLNEQTLPIKEVCFSVGFNNFTHFHKHFKATTGRSPSQYRKNVREIINV